MESHSRSRASLVSPCSCLCRELRAAECDSCVWPLGHLSLQAGALGLSAGGGFSEWTELFLSPGDVSSVELPSWALAQHCWERLGVDLGPGIRFLLVFPLLSLLNRHFCSLLPCYSGSSDPRVKSRRRPTLGSGHLPEPAGRCQPAGRAWPPAGTQFL